MQAVKWTAYVCFGTSGLTVILAMASEAPIFIGAALSVALLGMGFLAADRALLILTDIRNALVPALELQAQTVSVPAHPGETIPSVRTAAEISADIAAIKARV